MTFRGCGPLRRPMPKPRPAVPVTRPQVPAMPVQPPMNERAPLRRVRLPAEVRRRSRRPRRAWRLRPARLRTPTGISRGRARSANVWTSARFRCAGPVSRMVRGRRLPRKVASGRQFRRLPLHRARSLPNRLVKHRRSRRSLRRNRAGTLLRRTRAGLRLAAANPGASEANAGRRRRGLRRRQPPTRLPNRRSA